MRIFHGPVNIAGIGGYLSKYERSRGFYSKFLVLAANPFFNNHDGLIISVEENGVMWWVQRCKFFIKALRSYDLFVFYFGQSLLPLSIDIPIIRLFRKKIVMIYCGSDARIIAIEKERNPFFNEFENELRGTLDDQRYDRTKKIRTILHGIFCHRIIAPRNLYDHVRPFVEQKKIVKEIWVHNLSAENCHVQVCSSNDSICSDKVKIVHIPSSPVVKGTRYVRAAIETLEKSGYQIEYREVLNVPHDVAVSELADADIIVDQLLLGGFGSLAVEGMSMGKPVICYLIDSVKREHYADCPLVSATIHDIPQKLIYLINNKEARLRIGKLGIEYCQKYFDNAVINEKMIQLYNEILGLNK